MEESKFKSDKLRKKHRCSESEDWISTMPDEILVSILSRLRMREAARSSILSRRWKFLWTFTLCLDFDKSKLACRMFFGKLEKTIEVERSRFVNWVNDVLRLHKAPTLDEFRIGFDVDDNTNKSDLDRWMCFAFERRTKILELKLLSCRGKYPELGKYRITTQFLSNYNLSRLTVCRFNSVDLTEQVLVHILSSCVHLEELVVRWEKSLVQAKFCGPLLKLKRLEIIACSSLTSVEISAVNLAYFQYGGPNLRISYQVAPCLVELYFMHPSRSFLISNVQTQFSHLPQLKTLFLDYRFMESSKIPEFPDFQNLNKLVLVLRRPEAVTPEFLVPKLKLFPKLREFALQLYRTEGGKVELPESRESRKVKVPKQQFEHQCLKVFEFGGFLPCRYHVELVWGVLRNTCAIEKIIISSGNALDPDALFAARVYAEFLKKKLPPKAQLLHFQQGSWNMYKY